MQNNHNKTQCLECTWTDCNRNHNGRFQL